MRTWTEGVRRCSGDGGAGERAGWLLGLVLEASGGLGGRGTWTGEERGRGQEREGDVVRTRGKEIGDVVRR
jgi:hypothetical protein